MKKYVLFFVQVMMIGGILFLAEASLTRSEEAFQKNVSEEITILITADQAEFDPQNKMAVYKGRVTVKQDNTFLYADLIEVYWGEAEERIKLIKAYDNIKIVQEDKRITAEKGIYYHQDRKVILTGNPMTRQGKNCITGDTITYLWDQGKVIIEGNAKATIAMEEETKDKSEQEKVD